MFLQNHYQNAYVTRDIKKAIALFRTQYNFEDFTEFEIANEISTPAGRGICALKMALGWIGNLQYELIEPVSGMVDIFKADLPDEYPMRLHHICMRVNDWDAFRAEVDRRKWPVVIEGSGRGGQLQYIYVDARESLGHYLEYCWMTSERWAQLGGR
jgi:Glyoxalase/Bleomycin resistance protein/Dioxygenase superfamily